MGEKVSKTHAVAAICIVLVLAVFWITQEKYFQNRMPANPVLRGETMGTFYHIKLVHSRLTRKEFDSLREKIDDTLDAIEQSMSIYDETSEVSTFNNASAGETVEASPAFCNLVNKSLELGEVTDGAFDPTVGPLVDLWGFGKDGRDPSVPEQSEIESAMQRTGWTNVVVLGDRKIAKQVEGLHLDFGAIAKGYAVDRIAEVIDSAGLENYMVEIGGEVYAAGLNSTAIPWRIGIDTPIPAALPGENLHGVVQISNRALATSGDYRNFHKTESGKLYSHIIDPRKGCPVRMPPASVTVVASDCLTADALATAIFVLGEEDGLKLIEDIEGVEALFVISDYGSIFRESASSGFKKATVYEHGP